MDDAPSYGVPAGPMKLPIRCTSESFTVLIAIVLCRRGRVSFPPVHLSGACSGAPRCPSRRP